LPRANNGDPILQVRDLSVGFHLGYGTVRAVDHLSFEVERGSMFGVVGESGSGKSVTALTTMGLLQSPPGRVDSGEILLDGEDLLKKSQEEMRRVRGKRVSMIYQDPMTSLNPVFRVGFQIEEALMAHEKVPRRQAEDKAIELLAATGIPDPEKRVREFPHQFSGGMRQRIMIAMALVTDPVLLIADEPTTALDVITQAQILELLRSLQQKRRMSVMLITHDLGIVAQYCQRVLVMYAGHGMELGTAEQVFDQPRHPYTVGLLGSMTRVDADVERLNSIPGEIADLVHPPSGCRFHPRCYAAFERCRLEAPPLFPVEGGRASKCWLEEGGRGGARPGGAP
jgi:oligopeptide/dipeptide ABC transporter ATP-binding protein